MVQSAPGCSGQQSHTGQQPHKIMGNEVQQALPRVLTPTFSEMPYHVHAGMFLEEGVEHWEAVNRVNYLGVVYTLKAVVPGMVQRNSGRIIVTNSSGGFMGREALEPLVTVCQYVQPIANSCSGSYH